MTRAQTASINKIRADVTLVTRGFFILCWLPAFILTMLILPVFRDLLGARSLRSPLISLLVALTIAGHVAANYGIARMTAPYLRLLIGSLTVLVIGGAALVVTLGTFVAQEPSVAAWVFVAALAAAIAAAMYWVFLSPTIAAVRLLTTRVPPEGTPLPAVFASPVPQVDTDSAVPPSQNWRTPVLAYRGAAVALGVVAAALVIRLFSSSQTEQLLLASLVAVGGFSIVSVMWRRGRQLAAIDADAVEENDSRRPILYLRSFRDDPHRMNPEWDMVIRTPWGRARRPQGPIARLIASMPTGINSMSGGRLEERLAAVVAPIGPFVAVGAPDEPLPQLGAARIYLATDAWQSAVIKRMDRAQLIVTVAGPTPSVRWELSTILNRGDWRKLVVFMPPSTQEDNAACWATIVSTLQAEPWNDALASLDPREVIAIRLLDGGRVFAVTGDGRQAVDYVLAMRIMLHQMQQAVAD